MLCFHCHLKPASIFLSHMAGDKIIKLDLCEDCAKALGLKDLAEHSVPDLIARIEQLRQNAGNVEVASSRCPQCGRSLVEIQQSGHFGCPHCYVHFQAFVEPSLRQIQKQLRHTGKVPENWKRRRLAGTDRAKVEKELQAAVASEDFERAAQLRDLLKQIG